MARRKKTVTTREEFAKYAPKLGLSPDFFKKRIILPEGFGGTIIGLSFNTKYAVIVAAADKSEYGVTARYVAKKLS